ncbi:Uncharacterised protein [Xylophilus ampelinus]|nr:Uncharacterised protein [Xylophilus ampelinus]
MNKIKALAARGYTKAVLVPATLMVAAASASAQTTSSWDQFFDAVDFSGVSAKVVAGGLLIIGIAVAFKGPDLAKRLVRKA